jgi:hypothetical protein
VQYRVERVSRASDGGETDLVVDDDVKGAARAIAPGLRQIERFHDHALADERRVAVQDDGQHLRAIAILAPVLACAAPNLPPPDSRFRGGGIERQRQVHRDRRAS